MRGVRLRPEEALQYAVVQMVRLAFPRLLFFHVPNEKGTRTTFENMHLKRLGVVAGVADLIFCLPGGRFAAIELKAPERRSSSGKIVKAGKQTEGQEAFEARAVTAGGLYAVCTSVQEVHDLLVEWKAR